MTPTRLASETGPVEQPQIKRLIFDCDGLLLNTEDIYYEIGRRIIGRYGKTFEWSLKVRLMGMPWHEAVDLLIETLDLPISPEEYYLQATELHHLFREAAILPGVERLVRHLKAHQLPIAVASSSLTQSFQLKSESHGPFFALFDTIVLGDDPSVKRGKPHPDIFMEAARRLGGEYLVDFSDCLAFEDSPTGVMAARRAGMPVIWIPDPRMDQTLFAHDPHVHRLDNISQFDPAKWGLPPFCPQ